MSAAAGAGRGRRDAAPAPRHLYIHVPFCAERCDYCEFYSVPVGRGVSPGSTPPGNGNGDVPVASRPAGVDGDIPGASPVASLPGDVGRDRLLDRFVAALRAEWEAERARAGVRRLETVFIGGGTPSLLGEERLERLLEPLEALLTPCAEVTVETNPDDVTPAFAAWAAARRLRVSLGVQSFDARLRAALGRRGAADPAVAFHRLRQAGVGAAPPDVPGRRPVLDAPGRRPGAPGLGIDLIFGLPGQGAADLERELAAVAALSPDHVSWYELGLVPGSALAVRVALTDAGSSGRKAPVPPDDETGGAMYRRLVAGLGRLGYQWYEVSNFARPGRRCRHNSAIWRGCDYLGIGPGAVGTVAGARRRDAADLDAWLTAIEGGREPPCEREALSVEVRARERLLLAARTGARVPLTALEAAVDDAALPSLTAAGLVSLSGGTLRVTRKGRYVANGVCVRLFRDSSFLEA